MLSVDLRTGSHYLTDTLLKIFIHHDLN